MRIDSTLLGTPRVGRVASLTQSVAAARATKETADLMPRRKAPAAAPSTRPRYAQSAVVLTTQTTPTKRDPPPPPPPPTRPAKPAAIPKAQRRVSFDLRGTKHAEACEGPRQALRGRLMCFLSPLLLMLRAREDAKGMTLVCAQ